MYTWRLISLLFCSIGAKAGIVGWSKTKIEKQRVPGSSPPGKRKELFQPCCDPQLIGNSWPGATVTWMQLMGFRSLTT